jgi:hypothetical protein
MSFFFLSTVLPETQKQEAVWKQITYYPHNHKGRGEKESKQSEIQERKLGSIWNFQYPTGGPCRLL